MFHGWDDFYLLIGSAAAALIGLLFVVATLTSGREASAAVRGQHLYLTPTVFHLVVVLLLSALALAPDVKMQIVGLVIAACALIGFIYGIVISIEFWRGNTPQMPHWSDFWCYAVTPVVIYVALAVAAALVWRAPLWAPYAAAVVLIALLLIAIRNAWDLVTWLAPRRE